MMLDPMTDEVLDFVGGRKDLEAGMVRAIGDPDRRFAEDKLRMLRAVRFAARFDFAIEEKYHGGNPKPARRIKVVSRERVRDELTKMLVEGPARGGLSCCSTNPAAERSASGDFAHEGRGAAT